MEGHVLDGRVIRGRNTGTIFQYSIIPSFQILEGDESAEE
jgi:hypothetical protein